MSGDEVHVIYRRHALQRMVERGIPRAAVLAAFESGEIIREYPDDQPFASRLILVWHDGLPVHVVAARDAAQAVEYIITVYRPDPSEWEADFRRRKP